MPLPHFLALVAAVTVVAALSVVAALMVGVPLTVLALGAALAALVAHLAVRLGHGFDGGPPHSPQA